MKWIVRGFGIVILIAALFVGIEAYRFDRQNFVADKSAPDYQSRIMPLWAEGNIPAYMDEAYTPDNWPWWVRFWKQDDFELKSYMLRYTLAEGAPRPAILVFPGGGYLFRSEKHEGIKVAEWLNSLGMAAFVVNYRLIPYTHPVPLQDAEQAIRVVRAKAAELNVDPTRIGVMGFSAGGHLAALLSTQGAAGTRPAFAVLGYGAIAPSAYPLSGLGERMKATMEDVSPNLHITANTPPTFLWHTKEDPVVPYGHSVTYYETLQENGVDAELHLFDKGTHGLGLPDETEEAHVWPQLLETWLARKGLLPQ